MTAGSTYTLTVTGLTDGINSATLLTQDFTVVSDTAGPAVTSVQQVGSNLEVKFDKKVSATNFTSLTTGTSASSDISLTKQGDGTAYITAAPSLDPIDTSNKTVLFPIVATVYGSKDTASVLFTLKNIEDTNGNKMAAYSQSLTLNKDKEKPTLASSVLDTSDNKTIYLTFSESVSDPNLTQATAITIVENNTAVDVSATYLAGAAAGDDILAKSDWTAVPGGVTSSKYVKLVLPVALKASKNYTITIPGSKVSDVAGNKMNSVSFDVTTTAAADSTKPVVSKNAAAIAVVGGKNVIKIDWSENVVLDDARNLSNYVLNGSSLPAGTVITNISASSTDSDSFAITLPADGVTADAANADLLVTGIKDKNGNVVVPTTLSAWNAGLDLADTKKPTLVSAKASGNTKLELTFSEPVALVADTVVGAGGYEITVTDGTTTANIDLDGDAVVYLGNTATITLAGDNFGDVDFTKAELTVAAGAVTDKANTPNALTAIAVTDDKVVTDEFVDVAGGVVATTDNAGAGNNFTEISVDITPTTNNAVDRIVKYEIYIAPATVTDYTKVSDVEKYLTKLATFLPADAAGGAKALTTAAGEYLSDGTTAIATFAANVDTYVVAIDELGNKGLISELNKAGINVAD